MIVCDRCGQEVKDHPRVYHIELMCEGKENSYTLWHDQPPADRKSGRDLCNYCFDQFQRLIAFFMNEKEPRAKS